MLEISRFLKKWKTRENIPPPEEPSPHRIVMAALKEKFPTAQPIREGGSLGPEIAIFPTEPNQVVPWFEWRGGPDQVGRSFVLAVEEFSVDKKAQLYGNNGPMGDPLEFTWGELLKAALKDSPEILPKDVITLPDRRVAYVVAPCLVVSHGANLALGVSQDGNIQMMKPGRLYPGEVLPDAIAQAVWPNIGLPAKANFSWGTCNMHEERGLISFPIEAGDISLSAAQEFGDRVYAEAAAAVIRAVTPDFRQDQIPNLPVPTLPSG